MHLKWINGSNKDTIENKAIDPKMIIRKTSEYKKDKEEYDSIHVVYKRLQLKSLRKNMILKAGQQLQKSTERELKLVTV